MNQQERREYLIRSLLQENPRYANMRVSADPDEQRRVLRSLMNIRMPGYISDRFLKIQDEYLTELSNEKEPVAIEDMEELQPGMYIWQGDITRLKVGAIVNAANSGMTGCYLPCHNCIDNCIHTYAGIQLRNRCADIMSEQGYEEPTGQAKITPGYNLPCDYVIHTVGPIISGELSSKHEELLQSSYRSCLAIADSNNVESIAFCCISTGVFMFPNERAAEIAVDTVRRYREETGSTIKVVFNVFLDKDDAIYRRLLG